MRILIVSQHYWPENFRITDIAESLVDRGNEVTVLCGLPNYPDGYIYEGYNNKEYRNQFHNGVKIVRVKEIGRRNNLLFRLLNYWSYPHYAKKMVRKLPGDFDVVLINGLSPIMSAKPGISYSKKYKKPTIMYEMDLWPESLLAGGIKPNSLVYKHYKKVSSNIYSKIDKILVSTKEHIGYIKTLPNCQDIDMDYLPQYADTIFENTNISNIDNGIIDLMFAGNIGKAQSLQTIIRTASLLTDKPNYKFHIVGSGSELENCKKLAKEIGATNVIFYGQKQLNEMPALYELADVMLVSLEDQTYANLTIPGKLQSYIAAGKPIIGLVKGSTEKFIIDNSLGYALPINEEETLYQHILKLSILELRRIGSNNKQVYFEKFSKNSFIDSLLDSIKELIAKYN